MRAKACFDTSVLVYTLSDDALRAEIALRLLREGGFISVQVLNEFANVARKKLRMEWNEIERALKAIREFCEPPISVSLATHQVGVEIAQRYKYQIYDSLIIASAIEARCKTLYSEDMQDGQTIGSLTIRNPFLAI